MIESVPQVSPAQYPPGARPCGIQGVVAFTPRVFGDARGRFIESHHAERYARAGVPAEFAQDNVAWSSPGVLRGLHYQHPYGQGKLVTVLRGRVYDVAADVRVGSPTFGEWVGLTLDADGESQLWVPPGFAHGYLVLDEDAIVTYKCTTPYRPDSEHTLRWDDPELAVAWPAAPALLSDKDRAGLLLADALARGELPPYDAPQLPEPATSGAPPAARGA